jgi:hypothetical protein
VDPEVKLIGAWAKVYRKDRKLPFVREVPWQEMVKLKFSGEPNKNWSAQPTTMATKVALARALRDAFPEDLGGEYSDVEGIPEPEATPASRQIGTREERQAEPAEPIGEEDQEAAAFRQRAEQVRSLIFDKLRGQDQSPTTVAAVMVQVAAQATGQSKEAFRDTAAWSLDVVESCAGWLGENSIDPKWLPKLEGPPEAPKGTDDASLF